MALIQFRQVDGLQEAVNTVSGSALAVVPELNRVLSGVAYFSNNKYFNGNVNITGTLSSLPTGGINALNLSGNSLVGRSYTLSFGEEADLSISSPNTGRLRLNAAAGAGSGILEFNAAEPISCTTPGLDASNQDFPLIVGQSTGALAVKTAAGLPVLNFYTAGGLDHVGIANTAPESQLDISGLASIRGQLGFNSLLHPNVIDNVVITPAADATNNLAKLRLFPTQASVISSAMNSGIFLQAQGSGDAMTGTLGTTSSSAGGIELDLAVGLTTVASFKPDYSIDLGGSGAYGQTATIRVQGDIMPSGTGSALGSSGSPWRKIYSDSAVGADSEEITILPTDFVVTSFNATSLSYGNVVIYDTTGTPTALQVPDTANNTLVCFKTIPKGYKGTSFGISGLGADPASLPSVNYQTGKIYNMNVGGSPVGGIAGDINQAVNITAGYQLQGGEWDATMALELALDSSGDRIYGGYIGIERI